MKSLIAHLGTDKFNRISMGIGRPTNGMKISDYVLSNFQKDEESIIGEAIYKECRSL